MVKITLDGKEIEVREGQTILQAALAHGVEIPHFCYHPGLSIAGNCRMCLVEVEKAPKLVIGCYTPVAEGMVVNTRNDRVKEAQRAVMEFLLINHPLDCPICDQAGECTLQDNAVEYGTGKSRYNEPKLSLAKAVDIGEHVMLDQERCIQCSRCIRFCDEVTGTSELDFFQRGDRTMIGLYPDRRLDNDYSGNVVDICPVGALTLKEFRFQTRVWYLNNTPSVCVGCARGCNVMVATGTQNEQFTSPGQFDDRIKRMVPRHNEAVNGHWMCDEGRLSFKRQDAAERLRAASAAGQELEWDDAVARAARLLGQGRVGALLSPRLTSEDLYAWNRLLGRLEGAVAGVVRIERGRDDELLIRADKGANSTGARWILGDAPAAAVLEAATAGRIDTLLVVGDPLDPADIPALDEAVRAGLAETIYVGPFKAAAAEQAGLVIPTTAWAEEAGHVVNFEGRIQKVARAHRGKGHSRPGWRLAADIARKAGADFPLWADADAVFADLARDVPAFDVGEDVGLLGATGRRPATMEA